MAKPFCSFELGDRREDEAADEKVEEMLRVMQVMLANGFPPDVIIQRIVEQHKNNHGIPMKESVIREAKDAFHQFMEKFQKAQRVVTMDLEETRPSCDSIKQVGTECSSKTKSSGKLDMLETEEEDEEIAKNLAKLLLSRNSKQGRGSRPQSRGFSDHDSREELKPIFLNGSQEALATHTQDLRDTSLEPPLVIDAVHGPLSASISRTYQIKDIQSELQNLPEPKDQPDPQYLPEPLPKDVPRNVIECVSSNDAIKNENIAEKLVEKTSSAAPQPIPNQGEQAGRSSSPPNSRSNTIPLPSVPDPPVEVSYLAGGEGGLAMDQTILPAPICVESREAPQISRSAHRSSTSSSRLPGSRRRVVPKKKETTNQRRTLLLGASLCAFLALGGFIIYKNNNLNTFQF